MSKFYVDSVTMLMADGKEHTWKPMDIDKEFNTSVELSFIHGGFGFDEEVIMDINYESAKGKPLLLNGNVIGIINSYDKGVINATIWDRNYRGLELQDDIIIGYELKNFAL